MGKLYVEALCGERPTVSRGKGMSRVPKRAKRLTSANAGSPKSREAQGDGVPIVVSRQGKPGTWRRGTGSMAVEGQWMRNAVYSIRGIRHNLEAVRNWRAVCAERCKHGLVRGGWKRGSTARQPPTRPQEYPARLP
jgi:hypothetical protein